MMKMRQKWQDRLTGTLIFLSMLAIGLALILKVFNDNVIFYYSPTELATKQLKNLDKPFRVGGLVKDGTLKKSADGLQIEFVITDLEHDLKIRYKGMVPNLFQELQGTVALGALGSDGVFVATELLAKHDENYMPKEVADSIKKSGQWKK